MHNTNGKILQTVKTVSGENGQLKLNCPARELNGNSIILLRGAKNSENNHILLRSADGLNQNAKANILFEDGKLGQFLIQQGDLSEGVVLQTVKRLGSGTPILLLSDGGTNNGHILIQTAQTEEVQNASDAGEESDSNILVQALEGLKENDNLNLCGKSSSSTPLGSGKLYFFFSFFLH